MSLFNSINNVRFSRNGHQISLTNLERQTKVVVDGWNYYFNPEDYTNEQAVERAILAREDEAGFLPNGF